jgi:N-acetyl-1-D-myo-inositol-2-amino-2-deoxy-alpha-D-glucopyranoside deacetylase
MASMDRGSSEDGMLPWIDHALLEADILRAIRRTQPDVLITFDEDGLYWHPDHIAVHERTTAVVARLGPSAPALFYVSMPPGAMRALGEAAASPARPETSGAEPRPARVLGVDPSAFGSIAPAPTLIVDAGPMAARKLAALRCHRTQVEGSELDHVDAREAARLLGIEHYRRGRVGARGDTFIERFGTPAATAKS